MQRKVSLPWYGSVRIGSFGPPGRALAGGHGHSIYGWGNEFPGVGTMYHGTGSSTGKELEW